MENTTEGQLPTPVLPDATMGQPDEIEPAPVADLAPTPPKPRGRPRREDAVAPQVLSEMESDKWDYDSWITSFQWDQPGMQCKVERIAPEMVGTVMTAGTCGVFDNMPLSTQQIQQQFGGGRYHISVIGPRQSKKTGDIRIMRLSHKPLKIPGDPNLENLGRIGQDNAAQVARARGPQGGGNGGGNDPGMIRLVDSMVQPLQRRVDMASQQSMANAQMVGGQFQEAANMKIAAAERMMAEKDRLVAMQIQQANQRVDEARREAEMARQEKEKAMNDAREAQARIYNDRQVMEEHFTKKLQSVHGESNTLIATLLPAAQQNAQQQINLMMNMFESRLSSQETSYANRIDNLDRSYQQRMAAQADLFKTQMESAAMLYQGQIQHLQLELQSSRNEKQLLMTQLEDTRNRLMEEVTKLNKASDPEEQIVKLGSLLETVKSITGAGSSDEDKAPSSGNPFFDGIMANVGKVAEVIPHITGAITAKAHADAAVAQRGQMMPQMNQQMNQQQPQMLQPPQQSMDQQSQPQPQQRQPQRAAPRRAAPQAAAKPAAPPKKIPREELDKAVTYVNAALSSNPDLDPGDFANMAISSVDNNVLRTLSRHKSKLVVDDLENKGVLHGNSSTEAGKAFLCAVLDVLREKL